jgi:hypothetical protein
VTWSSSRFARRRASARADLVSDSWASPICQQRTRSAQPRPWALSSTSRAARPPAGRAARTRTPYANPALPGLHRHSSLFTVSSSSLHSSILSPLPSIFRFGSRPHAPWRGREVGNQTGPLAQVGRGLGPDSESGGESGGESGDGRPIRTVLHPANGRRPRADPQVRP